MGVDGPSRPGNDDAVSQQITLECVDVRGERLQIEAEFRYDPTDDPFAVTTAFPIDSGRIIWRYARDLLCHGVVEPTGDGDVRVRPQVGADGDAQVVIELSSPDGHLEAEAPASEVISFVQRSMVRVPSGTESEHLDLDGLIARLAR